MNFLRKFLNLGYWPSDHPYGAKSLSQFAFCFSTAMFLRRYPRQYDVHSGEARPSSDYLSEINIKRAPIRAVELGKLKNLRHLPEGPVVRQPLSFSFSLSFHRGSDFYRGPWVRRLYRRQPLSRSFSLSKSVGRGPDGY